MKTAQLLALLLIISALSTSCLKDTCTETRTFERWDPVYRSKAQLNEPITVVSSRKLKQPGIIYFYNDYILINEYHEGIHVINNKDQKNPVNEAFIEIEGNEHFAVINHQLQANKYSDLLTIDISDIHSPVQKSRIHNVFQEVWEDPVRGFLVGYKRSIETVTLDCSSPNFNSLRWSSDNGSVFLGLGSFRGLDFLAAGAPGVDASGSSGAGLGGSMARFTITANHLYIVSDYELKVFDLSTPSNPAFRNVINLGWGIETIYPFKEQLFIGSRSGMHVFDISDPASPFFLSMFEHARACDPVVSDDSTAFVTLHDGSECEGFQNQLDVIAVDNILSPRLLKTYAMKNPHGLALAGDILYVCEGQYGLKVLNIANREQVEEIDFRKDVPSKDVITLPNETILVIGDSGFKQFDVKDPRHMKLLSEIPVEKS
jgi:hypothetical protein